jgi:hypothetical protein
MTTILTAIDSTYSSNDSAGRKSMYFTVSLVNPYSAAGEVLTVSSYFPHKFLGGTVTMIHQPVTIALAGVLATGKFRGDTTSTTVAILQFFNAGLSGTANAGLFVDNTTANLSTGTVTVNMVGY